MVRLRQILKEKGMVVYNFQIEKEARRLWE